MRLWSWQRLLAGVSEGLGYVQMEDKIHGDRIMLTYPYEYDRTIIMQLVQLQLQPGGSHNPDTEVEVHVLGCNLCLPKIYRHSGG